MRRKQAARAIDPAVLRSRLFGFSVSRVRCVVELLRRPRRGELEPVARIVRSEEPRGVLWALPSAPALAPSPSIVDGHIHSSKLAARSTHLRP